MDAQATFYLGRVNIDLTKLIFQSPLKLNVHHKVLGAREQLDHGETIQLRMTSPTAAEQRIILHLTNDISKQHNF